MVSKTKAIALVAALSATNAAFRIILLSGPPNVKPAAFIVMIAGIVAGPGVGVAVGFLSMIASDLYLGAGVWTFETSAGMGIVSLLAAVLWHKCNVLDRWRLAVGGFFITMIYDVATSASDALLFHYPVTYSIAALYIPFLTGAPSPYPFGFVHELTTATLLGTLGPSLNSRIKQFYA